MRTNLAIVVCAALLCGGCGGWFGRSGGNKGLLFYRYTGSADLRLHRINSGGGGVIGVPGTAEAFEGSMDQDKNVYTSLDSTGSVYRITNGSAFKLTTSSNDLRPVTTPDGTRIVFISQRDGNYEIYLVDGAGATETNLTNSPASDYYPAISRDGSKVVFESDRDGNPEIYIVNFDGSGVARLTNDASEDTTPAFTPDGTQVIFSSNRGGSYQIYRMDLDGTNVTQVTTTSGDKFHASYKVDGSTIYYYEVVSGVRQIFRCNADGSGETQLTNSADDSDKLATWVY